jgi:hypothetical protein
LQPPNRESVDGFVSGRLLNHGVADHSCIELAARSSEVSLSTTHYQTPGGTHYEMGNFASMRNIDSSNDNR